MFTFLSSMENPSLSFPSTLHVLLLMANLTKGVIYVLVAIVVACVVYMMAAKRQTTRLASWQPRDNTYESNESPRPDLTTSAKELLLESYKSSTGDSTSPQSPFAAVKKFAFFAGYGRSGSSIIGALMDAHPHVVMAHEAKIFSSLIHQSQVTKASLYNRLYKVSVEKEEARKSTIKGYTLDLPGWWQGSYDKYVEVIGAKAAGSPTSIYRGKEKLFKDAYQKLKNILGVPIAIIQPIRNPFDIIATTTLYNLAKQTDHKVKWWDNETHDGHIAQLQSETKNFFSRAATAHEMIEQVFGRENVLEVHNCDLVDDPKATMSRVFQFLGVDASEELLDACAGKIFKSVSRSRDMVKWTPNLKERVEKEMKKYKSLKRYSFTSD